MNQPVKVPEAMMVGLRLAVRGVLKVANAVDDQVRGPLLGRIDRMLAGDPDNDEIERLAQLNHQLDERLALVEGELAAALTLGGFTSPAEMADALADYREDMARLAQFEAQTTPGGGTDDGPDDQTQEAREGRLDLPADSGERGASGAL